MLSIKKTQGSWNVWINYLKVVIPYHLQTKLSECWLIPETFSTIEIIILDMNFHKSASLNQFPFELKKKVNCVELKALAYIRWKTPQLPGIFFRQLNWIGLFLSFNTVNTVKKVPKRSQNMFVFIFYLKRHWVRRYVRLFHAKTIFSNSNQLNIRGKQ